MGGSTAGAQMGRGCNQTFIEAERNAGVADVSTRYLLFQENIDAQKQPEYIKFLRDNQVDDHN